MRQTSLRVSLLFATLLLSVMLAPQVLADILVMQDGSRLEIEGEWRDKGRVIQFTLPNGTLGSVRASEVDLEASREATRIANEPPAPEPEAAPKEKPEPIAVWTDKDIPQASPDVLAGASANFDAQSVQVVNWEADPGDGNIVATIRGRLQNYGNNTVTGLSLSVTVTGNRPNGDDPSLIRQARLDATDLGPGESTGFSVEIRRGDVVNVGTAEEFAEPSAAFQVAFESNPLDAEDDAGEGDTDDDGADDFSSEG